MIGQMSQEILANFASDYSKEFRKNLVSTRLFPQTAVSRAAGNFAKFSKEDLYHVPDPALLSSKAEAREVEQSHEPQEFACLPYAFKEAIANTDIEKADGAYPKAIRRTVERLTGKLELAQEKRVASLVMALVAGLTLAGVGDAKTNKWINAGVPAGKPIDVITEVLDKMPIRGNTIIIPRSVWTLLKSHKDLVNILPSTAYKTLTIDALKDIFEVEQVLIANGALKKTRAGSIDSIWGNIVVCAYVDSSDDPDVPTAGRTLYNEYAKGGIDGWITREYPDERIGLKGGRWYQVGHEADELIVAPELIRVIKDVL